MPEDSIVDTNNDLAKEYLTSGTYHAVVFVFDPDLTKIGGPSQKCSFQHMEEWFDTFKQLCFKSRDHISLAFVANRRTKSG